MYLLSNDSVTRMIPEEWRLNFKFVKTFKKSSQLLLISEHCSSFSVSTDPYVINSVS